MTQQLIDRLRAEHANWRVGDCVLEAANLLERQQRALDERLAMYRKKRSLSDPMEADSRNRHVAFGDYIEVLKRFAGEAGLAFTDEEDDPE